MDFIVVFNLKLNVSQIHLNRKLNSGTAFVYLIWKIWPHIYFCSSDHFFTQILARLALIFFTLTVAYDTTSLKHSKPWLHKVTGAKRLSQSKEWQDWLILPQLYCPFSAPSV